MQDLEEAYRRGVEPQLIRLLSVLPNLEAGEADAVQTVRNVSHQLKGSGSSFGHPEVTTLAAAVLAAPDSELAEAARPLISAIEEVLASDKPLRRILIVDDDPLIRMIVTKTIEAPGRTFETAGSLAEARKAMDATTDLVLLDLLLPDGDGRQLLRYAQGSPETARIPVVVLSGSGSDPIRQAAMNAGAAAFVEKPFDPNILSELVDELLAPSATAPNPSATGPSDSEGSHRTNVLLAEDDDLVAALISDRLARDGFEIRRLEDGESALDEALREPPDLAILDVMMPKMNGFEVLGRIRSAPQTADLPVIILTGRGREEDVVRGFDLGATDYIVKPFSPAELAVRVRRHTTVT